MRATQIRSLASLAFGLVLTTGAQAQLFKCVQGGKTVYQDAPCSDAAQQSTVRPPAPGPVAAPPQAEGNAPAPTTPAAAPTGNALEVVSGFTICAERVPNFQRKYTDAYAGWKMRNASALDRLSSEPDASRLDQRLREERERPASESIFERCAGIATTIQPPREAGLPKVVK